jgi:uncharacterized protein
MSPVKPSGHGHQAYLTVKLLCLTDLHQSGAMLRRIMAAAGAADLVLLGGDLTDFGTPEDAEELVRQSQTLGVPVLAVAGNCDSAGIDQRLVELGVSLHGRGLVHQGVGIHGLSGIPPWRGGMHQFTEEQLAAALQAGHAEISAASYHVLLAHVPPQGGKLDRTFLFQHVGSGALRNFIDAAQPQLVICGHVHEACGTETLGRTVVVNCGPAARGQYALAEVGDDIGPVPRVALCKA